MSCGAINGEGISKGSSIGARQEPHRTLVDSIAGAIARPFTVFRRRRVNAAEEDRNVWALKDVSFEIQPGEVVGVIGRNGAGKSTLLKILSRITEPTSGVADLHGRIGSLLEVGTGFHGELTGRENIYLNGAILGMRAKDINRQFDRIVAFADLEKFFDTPRENYHTAIYITLAFPLLAHLLHQ